MCEHSPWIAERALALRSAIGFATRAALYVALVAAVQSASGSEKLELLSAQGAMFGALNSRMASTCPMWFNNEMDLKI